MILYLVVRYLWVLPAYNCAFNVVYFVTALLRGEIRSRQVQFAVLYALTVPPAVRGDLEPFFRVRMLP